MKNKVYCKDCKWHMNINYTIVGYSPNPDRCTHPSQKTKTNSAVRESFTYLYYCESLNKNNDCSNYKRKWWKFWVK